MKLIWLLLLTSCATSLKVRSLDCPSDVVLMPASQTAAAGKTTFGWSEFGFGVQEVQLNQLLQEQAGLSCRQLSGLRLNIARTGWDQTLSLIPFYSRWTITLEWDQPQVK